MPLNRVVVAGHESFVARPRLWGRTCDFEQAAGRVVCLHGDAIGCFDGSAIFLQTVSLVTSHRRYDFLELFFSGEAPRERRIIPAEALCSDTPHCGSANCL